MVPEQREESTIDAKAEEEGGRPQQPQRRQFQLLALEPKFSTSDRGQARCRSLKTKTAFIMHECSSASMF